MPKLRIDDKIILRLKEDLYVQLTREEALPVVKSLLGLYEDKLNSCKGQISKIMSSMREMENLLTSYQNLI
jgi:prefoldin subunit 5